jgi:hypothetical protein
MGRKVRAAKASLVAAFLAAGGAAATAKAGPASHGAKAGASAARANTGGTLKWGSPLVRFLKLDGFPAYLKIENFTQYYKMLSLPELSDFYAKDTRAIIGVLDVYQKGGTAHGSLLEGILIGLEQYWKQDNSDALLNFLKVEGALDAYLKYGDFFLAMERDAPKAFEFYVKTTGIAGVPAVQREGGEIG